MSNGYPKFEFEPPRENPVKQFFNKADISLSVGGAIVVFGLSCLAFSSLISQSSTKELEASSQTPKPLIIESDPIFQFQDPKTQKQWDCIRVNTTMYGHTEDFDPNLPIVDGGGDAKAILNEKHPKPTWFWKLYVINGQSYLVKSQAEENALDTQLPNGSSICSIALDADMIVMQQKNK